MMGWDKDISLTTRGEFHRDKDRFVISYITYNENFKENDSTKVEIDSNRKVIFTREGKYGTHIIIEMGRKNFTHLETDEGDVMIGIRANSISNKLDDNGGSLSLSYSLDINSTELYQSSLEITVKELGG